MKILVTGGAGFIGSHTVERLLAAGHTVEVIDTLATGRRHNLPGGVPLHEADIRSPAAADVFASFQPEAVIHLAAQSSVRLSTADPLYDLAVNGGGTLAIAGLCATHSVGKLVYISTGGALYGEPVSVPVAEDHPIAPISAYGFSKRVGELAVELAGRTKELNFTTLRLANVYGPRQDPNGEAGVVAIFIGHMLAGQPCTIDGDGEQQKDYLYVDDITRAVELALSRGEGEALNIGSGRGMTVNEIFAALQGATGDATPPEHGQPRPGDVRRIWLDSSRAREVLGWAPETDFDEGLRLTVESLRATP